MAIDFSNFFSSIGSGAEKAVSGLKPSPGWEEILSAVPALVGAFERNKPIGGPLSLLGNWGMQNAEYRKNLALGQGNTNALQTIIQGMNLSPTSEAGQEFAQLQPQLGNLTPDVAEKQLEGVQAETEKERAAQYKNFHIYRNPDTHKVFQQQPDGSYKENKLLEAGGDDAVDPAKAKSKYTAAYWGYLKQHPGDFQGGDQYARQLDLRDKAITAGITGAEQLKVFGAKLDMADKKPASSEGITALGPDGEMMGAGTIGDVKKFGGVGNSDRRSYILAKSAIKQIDNFKPIAAQIQKNIQTLLPKTPDLISGSGVSLHVMARVAPKEFGQLNSYAQGIANVAANAQIGGKAQQIALQIKEDMLGHFPTLEALEANLDVIRRQMVIDRDARIQKGRDQAERATSYMMGVPPPDTTPSLVSPDAEEGSTDTGTSPSADEGSD